MSNSKKKFLRILPFILFFIIIFITIFFIIKLKLDLEKEFEQKKETKEIKINIEEKSVFISNLASAMYIADEDEKKELSREYLQDLSVLVALEFQYKKIDSLYFYFGSNIYDHDLGFRRSDIFVLVFSNQKPRWIYLSDYQNVYIDSVETFKMGSDNSLKITMGIDSILSQKLIDKNLVKKLNKRLSKDTIKVYLKGKVINLKNMSIETAQKNI